MVQSTTDEGDLMLAPASGRGASVVKRWPVPPHRGVMGRRLGVPPLLGGGVFDRRVGWRPLQVAPRSTCISNRTEQDIQRRT